MRINLPVHSYELRSRPASPARLVNCFPEVLPAGAKTPVAITRCPGVESWVTVGSGPIRGLYAEAIDFSTGRKDYLYVVSGDEWYYVDSAGSATLLGNIGTAPNPDMVATDGAVVVVNEPNAYYWDGTTFGQITDADFVARGAAEVEFLDNFLLFREPDSNRFFGSDLGSATSYDALSFSKVDAAPDELIGIITENRQLVCFGAKTTEIWENTGISGFPFERNINGTLEVGAIENTHARAYDMVFWVADDYTVRRLDGNVGTRVSTHAIEQKIKAGTIRSAFAYDQEGHSFYILVLDEGTYCYDVMTGEWSERQSYGRNNWDMRYAALFSGEVRIGDWNSNKVGDLSFDTYTEQGDVQRMEWTYQPVYAEQQRAFHKRLEIVLETGVGNTTGAGSDPSIMLDYSDDGGKSWTSMPDRKIGKRGESLTRAVWHNLGSARQRVYRAAVSEPVPITVTDTVLEADGGRL